MFRVHTYCILTFIDINHNPSASIDYTIFPDCRWENKDRDQETVTREELLASYFSLLDDDEILALYNIYQHDFKMFGYSFQFRGLKLNVD